jgi:hypothetical protein
MILLYTALLFLLIVARWLVRRRVASLEKRYTRAAAAAEQVLKLPLLRQGNNNRPDPVADAKRQYLLGQSAQKRDAIEARYTAWQHISDRMNRWVAAVRGWKGRKLPYTFGALDVIGLLALIDGLGVGQYVSVQALYRLALSTFGMG